MLRYLQIFDEMFKVQPNLCEACEGKQALSIIQEFAKRGKKGSAHSQIAKFYNTRLQKRNLALAILLMLKFESVDGTCAVIERILERIHRCESAQKQAYTLVLQHGAHMLVAPTTKGQKTQWDSLLPSVLLENSCPGVDCAAQKRISLLQEGQAHAQEALLRVFECVEDYLDTHKENAFKSAVHEPARLYFDLCGNHHHRDHVNVHGLNGFLCLLRGGLDVQLPIVPMEDDPDAYKGCADIWAGLDESAWTHFSAADNFGKDFEGIAAFKGPNAKPFLRSASQAGFDSGRTFIGRTPRDLENRAKRGDADLLGYFEKFSHFFSKDFLVRRMFEVLNAENKPEHMGFRKSCEVLFPLFKENEGITSDSLLEHLYDEWITNLDVDRTAAFFRWLGVVH